MAVELYVKKLGVYVTTALAAGLKVKKLGAYVPADAALKVKVNDEYIDAASTPVVTQYNVVNTSNTIPTAGNLHIPPSGLTLRIHVIDADGNGHASGIASLVAGDIIHIGASSCVLAGAPIFNTGVFALFVTALPVVADGLHAVSVTKS